MNDRFATRLRKTVSLLCVYATFASTTAAMAQNTTAGPNANNVPDAPPAPTAASAFNVQVPHSHNPLGPYTPSHVAAPVLSNSPRLASLIRDGKLYLSLNDSIELALENNLDLAIARYNVPIADTDILRTKAGGSFRGVNTGVVQGTPGGGVGGFGSGAPGAGAGGTSSGAGGAGAGAAGLVQSTLGSGTFVNSFDPQINANIGVEHATSPLSNQTIYGVPSLQLNTTTGNFNYQQAFATGTQISFDFNNNRQITNSPNNNLNPSLNSLYRISLQQPLLAGFGFGPNLRYLRIAKNNKKISDIAFKDQVTATVTQIANIYWDLVGAFEQARVNQQSLDFANQTLDNTRKQLKLEAVPEMDVLRAEAEVSKRAQDLTVANTNLELQASLIKNAITRSLDDPVLEAMPVVPTDRMDTTEPVTPQNLVDLITHALQSRPELLESDIDLENRRISQKATRNALLPSVNLVGFYGSAGLAGLANPAFVGDNPITVPPDWGGSIENAFNGSSPDYYVGVNVNIPIRNRIAKADQFRSELEYRQSELRREQLKKQIRIEVRNAQYAYEQTAARVEAAIKARDLAQRTFETMKKEQDLGAGSIYQTMTAQRDLALASLDLVTAQTIYQKSKVELDRATAQTLEHNGVHIQEAITGVVAANPAEKPAGTEIR
ncbi:outer membrane efflux protein [Candidatus Koribacter versatilis Ellin345]|uniref:Outer membrane efflux protein n=1 Tax=Koribacter versatilis (strain Ellin345) TaxID=204669 RepID=Q1IUS2_KORVE|nr:TolC family protein [Candidatus Koribacter versatilis]ABF39378.1 outer membrane efflux protein [Candidatus Koribacter versatilis Ellin345]